MQHSNQNQTCEKLWNDVNDCQRRVLALQNLFHEDQKSISFVLQQSIELCSKIKTIEWELLGMKCIEKLIAQYDEAREMALEFSSKQEIPLKHQVKDELLKLGQKKILEIRKFGQPTLLITPPTTFQDKLYVVNTNRKYIAPKNHQDVQLKASLVGRLATDTLWNPKPHKLLISIVDGLPDMPATQEKTSVQTLSEMYIEKDQELNIKGQRMITAHEWLVLEHGSLKRYNKARNNRKNQSHQNPEKEIVDCNNPLSGKTIFVCDPNNFVMPCGSFETVTRQIYLDATSSIQNNKIARFRPAITVFEF